jgi:hypothetical protein
MKSNESFDRWILQQKEAGRTINETLAEAKTMYKGFSLDATVYEADGSKHPIMRRSNLSKKDIKELREIIILVYQE